MSKPRPALVVFWVSLAILVGAVLYLGVNRWQAAEDADIESVGVRPNFSATPTPTPTPTVSSASPSPTPSPSGPTEITAPTRVRIPAIDVDTKVFPVALDPNGAIEIPEDIRYVGWYKLGVPPGVDRGSAVLVAHRDGRVQGRGVFYDLGQLKPGNKIAVETAGGDELIYKVVSRELIQKKSLPYEELFAVDGEHRLTLISCGGYYDRNNGGYQDNVVVTAVPMFTPIPVPPADPNAEPSYAPTPSPTPTKKASDKATPSPTPTKNPTSKPSQSKAQTFSNKPSKKANATPTPESTPEPSPTPASTVSSDQPVSVAVPGAGTIAETSTPVLLGGGKS